MRNHGAEPIPVAHADAVAGQRQLVDMRQLSILSGRYLSVIVGDFGYTLLLLAQAPIVAGLICLRWHNAPATSSLYFCLALGAIWLGCVNACREIAKERAIYERERRIGLQIAAYVLSKLQVLALLAAVQCALLVGIVAHYVPLAGSLVLIYVALWAAAVAGTALGLAISALAGTPDLAVGLVPVVMFPQILFSEFVLAERYLRGLAKAVERCTITKWSYELLDELTKRHQSLDWGQALADLSALALITVALLGLCVVLLKARE
ncbi:MAG: ABC transporter permease [Armatimonadota bacterium]|jgi:hypothetical protein